jgi:hypothetical protein
LERAFPPDEWLPKALVKLHPLPFVSVRDARKRNTSETDELRSRLLIKYKISTIYHYALGGMISNIPLCPWRKNFPIYHHALGGKISQYTIMPLAEKFYKHATPLGSIFTIA